MIETTDMCLAASDALNGVLDRSWLGRWFGTPRNNRTPSAMLGTPWVVDPNAPTRLDLARPTPIVRPERKSL